MMKSTIVTVLLLVLITATASAQDAANKFMPQGYVVIGEGVLHSDGWRGLNQFGAGGETLLFKGFGVGGELGMIGRPAHGNGIFSFDPSYRFRAHSKFVPFVETGYSRTFGRNDTMPQTNLFNFGGGFNYWAYKRVGLRLEFRDHIPVTNTFPSAYSNVNHFWDVRIGLTFR